MQLQVLSDLHLETEAFDPEPAPGADVLVLAGDIDSNWTAYERFAGWPVPVLVVPGNHEFDRRELRDALPAFRDHCARHGLKVLERDEYLHRTAEGRCVRFLGTVRWSDFDVFGPDRQAKALKAAGYFQKVMQATCDGDVFDAHAVRREALACRDWLAQCLVNASHGAHKTVVITHFCPSLRSADPRYGTQPTTASFCNADDDLIGRADLWIHGHVHWRPDYTVPRQSTAAAPAGGAAAVSRVVCQARGLMRKGEAAGFDPLRLIPV